MEERKLRGDLTAAFHCRKGGYRDEEVRLFSEVWSDKTRGNGHEFLQGKFQLCLKKKLFPKNMVQPWGRSRKEVGFLTLEIIELGQTSLALTQ